MEIKDINTQAQDLNTVRGGNAVFNTFVGGNANSTVSLGQGRNALLHSPVTVGVETVAANLVDQRGSIVDEYRTEFSFSVSDSMGVFFGR